MFHYSENSMKPGHCLRTDYSWDSLNDLYYWLLDKNSQNAVGIGFLTVLKFFKIHLVVYNGVPADASVVMRGKPKFMSF